MASSIKNILIGLFVTAAIGIIIFMLMFLHPKVGDNAKTLRVRFTDIDKVNVGTRVTFAGKPVGEVISITELPEARTERLNQNGDIYVYELTLKVDSGVDVFNSDDVMLRTSGLLGERNIEINPNPLKPGQELVKVEDEILYAVQTSSVEDTMKEIGQLSQKFGIVLDDFHMLMETIKEENIVGKIGKSIQNISNITDTLNQPEKWKHTVDNIFDLSDRAVNSWASIDRSVYNILDLSERAHRSWNTIEDSFNNFHTLSQKVNHSWGAVDQIICGFQTVSNNAVDFSETAKHIISETSQGNGTLGQLFVGNDLYLRLKSILHKGEIVMNDINSYGLLFHSNKRWQRLQSRRLRLLETLWNPNEFARYFNEEMDQISTSLSRVSMVLDEGEYYPNTLFNNPNFVERFSELLEKVENMDENLKMYNEQVIDKAETSCMVQ
jgi:phospholipid/cholesterol/gamma-HCH transport system substrate-binding protein